jgi:anti-anti-sigma factor
VRLADVDFSTRDKVLIAHLTGEVDLSNADQLSTALTDATVNELLVLVLDLSDVDYFDSAGIQLIYRLRESLRSRGQTLRLVIPSTSPVHHALRLAGVGNTIGMLESIDDALGGAQPMPAGGAGRTGGVEPPST